MILKHYQYHLAAQQEPYKKANLGDSQRLKKKKKKKEEKEEKEN